MTALEHRPRRPDERTRDDREAAFEGFVADLRVVAARLEVEKGAAAT